MDSGFVEKHVMNSLLGKTNMDEFGMGSGTVDSIFGPVKSLWRSGVVPYQLKELPALNKSDFQIRTDALKAGDFCIAGKAVE